MQRERDLTHQVESMTARIQALTEERDALRASEAELKLEVREASTRERSLTASLEAAQATISGLKAELQTTHASAKRYV
ncbi:hypothetical protein EON66_02230 [archaeon]|nr:MAG: hypothetical protein EON66_02230 [archaeon]